MGKLKNQITINLDDETNETLQAIARETQRKTAELLRLLIVPVIRSTWLKMQNDLHPENKEQNEILKGRF